MDMRSYLLGVSPEKREEVAKEADTSVAYLFQLAGGHRKASPDLARSIQSATNGAVTKEELRPDIWGEEAA